MTAGGLLVFPMPNEYCSICWSNIKSVVVDKMTRNASFIVGLTVAMSLHLKMLSKFSSVQQGHSVFRV